MTNLTDELDRARERIKNLLTTVDELQNSDSAAQLAAKRAERDLRESQERALKLEREMEGWKALRFDRTPTVRSGTLRVPSYSGSVRGRRLASGGSPVPPAASSVREGTPVVEATPPVDASLARKMSNTKGFL